MVHSSRPLLAEGVARGPWAMVPALPFPSLAARVAPDFAVSWVGNRQLLGGGTPCEPFLGPWRAGGLQSSEAVLGSEGVCPGPADGLQTPAPRSGRSCGGGTRQARSVSTARARK